MYLVELHVPTLALAPITNSDKDRSSFIDCHLFLDKIVGPKVFETYGT